MVSEMVETVMTDFKRLTHSISNMEISQQVDKIHVKSVSVLTEFHNPS